MTTDRDRQWAWFVQTREALIAALGAAVIVAMLIRNSWPPLGVIAALTCLGKVSASSLVRLLIGRWEGEGGK